MLPLVLPPETRPIILYGAGRAAMRRLNFLVESGAARLAVFTADSELRQAAAERYAGERPEDSRIAEAFLLFVAGLDDQESARVAGIARAARVLVNVEDRTEWCDFHVPAIVRRGDLLMTVSTGGHSPGLARRLKQRLEELFGPEWAERLNVLSAARKRWRDAGRDVPEVTRATNEMIEREGWL